MRRITFESGAFDEFATWAVEDKKVYAKLVRLIKDVDRSPFTGLGKPEPLRYEMQGYGSRRITDEHRSVYRVTDEDIFIVACKFHYDD